jgi:hypothetical protein
MRSQEVRKPRPHSSVNSEAAASQMRVVQGRWIPTEGLFFRFGGRDPATIRLNTLTLDVPPSLVADLKAAVVPAPDRIVPALPDAAARHGEFAAILRGSDRSK